MVKLNSASDHSHPASVTAIAVQGELAYVLVNHNQLQLLRMDSAVRKLATTGLENSFNAIAVSGHYCYLSGDDLGVQIVDISDPNKPQLISGFATQGTGQDIKIEDNLAYVADGLGGGDLLPAHGRKETFDLRLPAVRRQIADQGFDVDPVQLAPVIRSFPMPSSLVTRDK